MLPTFFRPLFAPHLSHTTWPSLLPDALASSNSSLDHDAGSSRTSMASSTDTVVAECPEVVVRHPAPEVELGAQDDMSELQDTVRALLALHP